MSYHSIESRGLQFPYKAKSPTLKKQIVYTDEELWKEIDRILAEDKKRKFTPGQNLYYNLLLCADSNYFFDIDTNMLLEEYIAMKRFNIPVARSIDEAEFDRVSLFSAIDEEYITIQKLEQDGTRKVHN